MAKDKKKNLVEEKKMPLVEMDQNGADEELITKAKKPKKNRLLAGLRRAWRAITSCVRSKTSSVTKADRASDTVHQQTGCFAEPEILGPNLVRGQILVHHEDEPDGESNLTEQDVRQVEDEASPIQASDTVHQQTGCFAEPEILGPNLVRVQVLVHREDEPDGESDLTEQEVRQVEDEASPIQASDTVHQQTGCFAEPEILGPNLVRGQVLVHREDEPDGESDLTEQQVRQEEDEASPIQAIDTVHQQTGCFAEPEILGPNLVCGQVLVHRVDEPDGESDLTEQDVRQVEDEASPIQASDTVHQQTGCFAEPEILGPNLVCGPVLVHREDEPDGESDLTEQEVRQVEDEASPIQDQHIENEENLAVDEQQETRSGLIVVDLSESKNPEEEDGADHSEKSTDLLREDQKSSVCFFIKDVQNTEDELAKKRKAFLRKRQKNAEEARLQKEKREAEAEIKRAEACQKAKEDSLRKEERESRKAFLRQEYVRKRQILKVEEIEKPKPKTTLKKPGPKPVHREESDSNSKANISSMCPKLYKEQASKTNREIIHSALLHACLAGKVNEARRKAILTEVYKCNSNHFIILLRGAACHFQGIYSYHLETGKICKVTGTGPKSITSKMIDKLYKYSSGRKEFTVLPGAKSPSIGVDALTIQNDLWHPKGAALPKKLK